MPVKIIRGRTLPIGLDIGSAAVKMAQLRQLDDAHELIAAACAPIAGEPSDLPPRLTALEAALPEMLRSSPFHGRQCLLSLPASHVLVQHVKLPKLAPAETARAVQFELQAKLPYPAHNAVVRHVVAGDVVGEDETRQEIIAVSLDRTVLDQYLRVCSHARLDVIGVNVESCAIIECFSRLFRRAGEADRTVLFVDLGAATTQVVLSHGERMVFARPLARGAGQFDRAVAGGLGLTPQQARSMRWDLLKSEAPGSAGDELYRCIEPELDALANELTQCLHYYETVFRNQPVDRAIFVGGGAHDKLLCQALAQRLNLPAQIGDPLLRINRIEGAGLQAGLDRRAPQPDWAVAVGLSIGAAA